MIARRTILSLLALGIGGAPLLMAPLSIADEPPRRAVLPLPAILARVEARYDGTVLDADIRSGKEGRLVYEVRLLSRRGNLLQIRLDAASGAFLEVDGHGFIDALRPGGR